MKEEQEKKRQEAFPDERQDQAQEGGAGKKRQEAFLDERQDQAQEVVCPDYVAVLKQIVLCNSTRLAISVGNKDRYAI
jgi:hypothetical protein